MYTKRLFFSNKNVYDFINMLKHANIANSCPLPGLTLGLLQYSICEYTDVMLGIIWWQGPTMIPCILRPLVNSRLVDAASVAYSGNYDAYLTN